MRCVFLEWGQVNMSFFWVKSWSINKTMSEQWPANVIAFSPSLPQRNPAGDPTSAPSAWGGVSAASCQRSAEPHPASWATTSQVPAFVFATAAVQPPWSGVSYVLNNLFMSLWTLIMFVSAWFLQATQRWAWTTNVYSAGESEGTDGAAGAAYDAS